jgi:phosphoribosylformylglycinamidine synthase subunit PurQ / glutaminase
VGNSFKGIAAVIQFPGVNCEYETAAAVRSIGLGAGIFRWNEDPALLDECAGIILPGGFAYQDRIRAGVVAAKDRIMDTVSGLARAGKPVLGICNGAQVLVESGLIPGIHWEKVDLALAPNVMADREGYYCTWVNLKKEPSDCFWTKRYADGEIIPIPIAHAEGRFVTEDRGVLDAMKRNHQIALRYCDASGAIIESFPTNPNGSVENIAGVSNREGNVLAMMPHPERATWLRQVPEDIAGSWSTKRCAAMGRSEQMENEGPGRGFFAALGKGGSR